jgi:hypothetical protein
MALGAHQIQLVWSRSGDGPHHGRSARGPPFVKHYTQQPSQLRTSSREPAILEVRGGGFVTRQMVHETLDGWDGPLPSGILIDLREVAGYESGCATLAHRWLLGAHRNGVRRVACIASSSVLRTVTRVASSGAEVDLRVFEDESTARSWLAAEPLARQAQARTLAEASPRTAP